MNFAFATVATAQNGVANALKDGVEAVKDGFSPLTNLISSKDSIFSNFKKRKNTIKAFIVSLSSSATALYIKKTSADPKPSSAKFKTDKMEVNRLFKPK